MKPTNLRVLHDTSIYAIIKFDGPRYNGYQICIRDYELHGNAPLEDDNFSRPRRRTWTGYMGADAGTRQRYAQSGKELQIIASEMPGKGDKPVQIIIWGKYDRDGQAQSNAVVVHFKEEDKKLT